MSETATNHFSNRLLLGVSTGQDRVEHESVGHLLLQILVKLLDEFGGLLDLKHRERGQTLRDQQFKNT